MNEMSDIGKDLRRCFKCNRSFGSFQEYQTGPYLWRGICYHCKSVELLNRFGFEFTTMSLSVTEETSVNRKRISSH